MVSLAGTRRRSAVWDTWGIRACAVESCAVCDMVRAADVARGWGV